MNAEPNITEPVATVPEGAVEIGGKYYMYDAKGHLVPVSMVKPIDLLMDEAVRKMAFYAADLSAQIGRFKSHCFDDVGSLQALLAQEYDTTVGGAKGNITLTTFDGTMKVTVQVQDQLEFGPELQTAKRLLDECLAEWADAEGVGDKLRTIITRAFSVAKEGQVNRAELFMLMRANIDDPRWLRAMDAIKDSIRPIGSKTYVRFHRRATHDAKWEAITIDLAQA